MMAFTRKCVILIFSFWSFVQGVPKFISDCRKLYAALYLNFLLFIYTMDHKFYFRLPPLPIIIKVVIFSKVYIILHNILDIS